MLLTARPARIGPLTVDWLARHDLRWDLLVMRRDGDYRPARHFKQEALNDIRSRRFDLKLCLEDDRAKCGDVPGRGCPLPLYPLRLLRLTGAAQRTFSSTRYIGPQRCEQ